MSIIGMRNKMSKYLKGLVIALAVAFAIGFIAMTIGPGKGMMAPGARQETGVLAKVNGEKLLWKDYLEVLRRQQEQYEMQGPLGPATETQLRGSIFDQMVDEMVRVQAAKKEGVRVSKGDVNKKVDEYVDMQIKSLREQALAGKKKKTDAVFEAQLAKVEPGMTIAKKRKQIKSELAKHSEEIRSSLLIEKLDKKLEDAVVINDKTLAESYDEAKYSQISVAAEGKRSDEQAKKRAEEIVAKLRGGGNFAAIAKESSDDMFKAVGGNRGSVRRAQVEPELRDIAFKLKSGEISDPVKISKGYAIIKSDGVTRNLPSDFNDAAKKRQYKEQFAQMERETAKQEFYGKMRDGLKLDVFDPEIKAYVAFKDAYQKMMTLSEAGRKQEMEKVIKLYQTAAVDAGEDTGVLARCHVQIATLYGMMRTSPVFGLKKDEAAKYEKLAKQALEAALNYTEDNGIRMGLARMELDSKNYDAAVENLQIASENAYDEVQTHEMIRDMYKEMKRTDLAAKEQKWVDDYKKEQAASGGGTATSQPITVPAGE